MLRTPAGDLYSQYLALKTEMDAAIADVIRESAFIRGSRVELFESEYAKAVGADHCVSCANGTDAIYIAMKALGVGAGDEVITTAHSWIATSETVTQTGAKVVFCDTERDTFTLDPAAIEARITPRTVGIIPVHMAGQPADMDAISAIAKRHGLWIIEDCAQAHLATFKGRPVGSFGAAATYSFYPGKNLGAMGDAGAITTNDSDLARRMSMFARHGGLTKGDHQIEGINSRLDGLQAAILSVKLPHLRQWTKARQDKAAVYDRALAKVETVKTPPVGAGREHVYHLYMIRHERRDDLARALNEAGIQTVINYSVSLPFLPAYARFGARPEDFPNAYHNQSRILSLPIYPEMTADQQAWVIERVTCFQDALVG